jgi:hypothetical protein
MDARKTKVRTYLRIEAVLLVVFATTFVIYRMWSHPTFAGKPDNHVTIRRVEATLTEIDLTNRGSAAGPVTSDIEAHWADSELKESAALSGFDRDESRHSVTFHPRQVTISPGETRGVGWVKLTDDSPVSADFTAMGATSQPSRGN